MCVTIGVSHKCLESPTQTALSNGAKSNKLHSVFKMRSYLRYAFSVLEKMENVVRIFLERSMVCSLTVLNKWFTEKVFQTLPSLHSCSTVLNSAMLKPVTNLSSGLPQSSGGLSGARGNALEMFPWLHREEQLWVLSSATECLPKRRCYTETVESHTSSAHSCHRFSALQTELSLYLHRQSGTIYSRTEL